MFTELAEPPAPVPVASRGRFVTAVSDPILAKLSVSSAPKSRLSKTSRICQNYRRSVHLLRKALMRTMICAKHVPASPAAKGGLLVNQQRNAPATAGPPHGRQIAAAANQTTQ